MKKILILILIVVSTLVQGAFYEKPENIKILIGQDFLKDSKKMLNYPTFYKILRFLKKERGIEWKIGSPSNDDKKTFLEVAEKNFEIADQEKRLELLESFIHPLAFDMYQKEMAENGFNFTDIYDDNFLRFIESYTKSLIEKFGSGSYEDLAEKILLDIERKYEFELKKNNEVFQDYKVHIQRNAKFMDLASELQDPSNYAVLYITHSGMAQFNLGAQGSISGGVVLDTNGGNVEKSLYLIHPNIRLFQIVGCSSMHVIGNVYQKTMLPEDTIVFGPSQSVPVMEGVKHSLQVLNTVTPKFSELKPKEVKTGLGQYDQWSKETKLFRIKIQRTNNFNHDLPPVSVINKQFKFNERYITNHPSNQIQYALGYLPALAPGESQVVHLNFPIFNADELIERENLSAIAARKFRLYFDSPYSYSNWCGQVSVNKEANIDCKQNIRMNSLSIAGDIHLLENHFNIAPFLNSSGGHLLKGSIHMSIPQNARENFHEKITSEIVNIDDDELGHKTRKLLIIE